MDGDPAAFVDAEIIKAKLDEIIDQNAEIIGRIEAIEAALGAKED